LTTKMLASTMQHSTNTHPHPPHHNSPTTTGGRLAIRMRMPPETTNPTPPDQPACRTGLFSQDPTGCLDATTTTANSPPPHPREHQAPAGSTTHHQPAPPVTSASVSAIEHPPDTSGPGQAAGRPQGNPQTAAGCSLERR